ELDRDGKLRWQIRGLHSPFQAQVLPGDRILVAEYAGGRVTERNLKGDILWQKSVPSAMQCQRLPNGNTFIVSPTFLVEVDSAGKEIFQERQLGSLVAAKKLRNGQIV